MYLIKVLTFSDTLFLLAITYHYAFFMVKRFIFCLCTYIIISFLHSLNVFGQQQGRSVKVPGRETITK